MKKRKSPILLVILIVVVATLMVMPSLLRPEEVSYTAFRTDLESGNISSLTFDDSYLIYKTENGESYSTVNPSSPTLKEELLLNNVEIQDDSVSLESITNTLFNCVFLFIITFGLYKGISWYHKTFKVVKHTGVKFTSIAGMDNLKRDMSFVLSVLKGDKSMPQHRPLKGIILEGPPGNGKTLFARALAEESDVAFIATKGADFQGAVMGLGAMKVKMLFAKAKKKKPCIIFIDEFDSIGEKRNYAGSGLDKENNRILTTLLNEMDGFEGSSGVLVIAATNSYASLDPALIRPGRFDLKYTVGNPDTKTIIELVKIYTQGKKYNSELTPEVLATVFAGLSSAAIASILNEAETVMIQSLKGEIDIECIVEAASRCKEKLNIKIRK